MSSSSETALTEKSVRPYLASELNRSLSHPLPSSPAQTYNEDNDTSPMTKEKHVGPLVPNHPLRGLIERWDEDAHAYFVTIHKRYREDKMDVQPAVAAAPAEESEEEEEVVLESGVLGDPVVRD